MNEFKMEIAEIKTETDSTLLPSVQLYRPRFSMNIQGWEVPFSKIIKIRLSEVFFKKSKTYSKRFLDIFKSIISKILFLFAKKLPERSILLSKNTVLEISVPDQFKFKIQIFIDSLFWRYLYSKWLNLQHLFDQWSIYGPILNFPA